MISKNLAIAAAIVLTVFGAATSTASAQRFTDPAWVTVPNGTVVRGGASNATLTTSLGTISCSLALRGYVTSPSTVSVSGPWGGLDWRTCGDTIPLFNVCAVTTVNSPITATITTWSGGGTVNLASTAVDVRLCSGWGTCRYTASVNAVGNNAANSLTVSQSVPLTSGPGICPASGTFATTLTPIYADLDDDGWYDFPSEYRVEIRS